MIKPASKLNSKVPLYLQVANQLKRQIRETAESSEEDTKLPTVRALSQEFGVSINVIQRALSKLEQENVIEVRHGSGIEVKSQKMPQVAVPFGFIHPFKMDMIFSQRLIQPALVAFNANMNSLFVDTSLDDPTKEREIAEYFIDNGASGLLIWPGNNDFNGEYFEKLNKKIPVVLVDRTFENTKLPSFILDYFSCGKEVAIHLFKKKKIKRLLIVMDNLHISSYKDMLDGLEAGAKELDHLTDTTVLNLPITQIITGYEKTETITEIYERSPQLKRIILEGSYDAVFCMHDEFIDYVMLQTGIMDDMRDIQLASLRGTGATERSLKYFESNCIEWLYDTWGLVAQAADALQKKVLFKTPIPKKNIVQLQLNEKRGSEDLT